MAAHTLLLAQSGSGKSFFLGRLIEELVLCTRAKCVIFDPNADFYRVDAPQEASLWNTARYDQTTRLGKLPTEARRQDFVSNWTPISKRILTGRKLQHDRRAAEALQMWWPDLDIGLLGDDLDPIRQTQLYHCHAFVQAVWSLNSARLLQRRSRTAAAPRHPIDIAESLFRTGEQLTTAIETEFPTDVLARAAASRRTSVVDDHVTFDIFWKYMSRPQRAVLATAFVERKIRQALVSARYVDADVAQFYFARAREFQAKDVLADQPLSARPDVRLEVVDLPSIAEQDTRLLIVSARLIDIWKRARGEWAAALEAQPGQDDRVPTFVVVDEAHNLIPSEPQSGAARRVREQFRAIAAEGRKYGLFLILVTQRPDKLDPLVVSECENKALMRMDSQSVLDAVITMCGLEDLAPRTIARCLEFGPGRACLTGRWAPEGPTFLYAAARRTVEGGRNLRASHWARG